MDTSFENERNKSSGVTSKNDLGLTIDVNFCNICVILQLKKNEKKDVLRQREKEKVP